MVKNLWIDIETYSTVDLRKSTPYAYSEDPAFQILMAAWSTDGVNVHVAIGEDQVLAIPGLMDPTVRRVAHNAPFERVCFSAFFGLPVGTYLPPEDWHDTQAVAGVLGYPQKLAHLGPALGVAQKDEAGTALINWFCKPDRKGQRRMPQDHPEKWAAFVEYCRQDVVTLIAVDRALGSWPTEMERRVYYADQHINDRGIAVDVDLARAAVSAAEENRMVDELEVTAMTGILKPGNSTKMRQWLQEQGHPVPNLQDATVKKLLAGDQISDDVRRVLELRQELALVASKKYTALLGAVSTDDRLRGMFRYFGAHTGRWSGRIVQMQNLPREAFMKPDPAKPSKLVHDPTAEEAAILDLLLGNGGTALDLKRLVRPTFMINGSVADFASIEARVIAWLAGEAWALEAFYEGRDIYVETAERMGGLTRAQGKIAVLALGFAGGVGSLRAMAGADDDFINDQSDQEVRDTLVQPWRKANHHIVKLWRDLEEAFSETGKVGDHLELTESEDEMGRTVHMWLPSGRSLNYHGVRWERYRIPDPYRPGRWIAKQGFRYANPRDPFNPKMRIGTYGGRLAENATQAVARDVQAEALVRLTGAGVSVVGHVHDEVLAEDAADHSLTPLMTRTPRWAADLPIDAEGFPCRRYKKG